LILFKIHVLPLSVRVIVDRQLIFVLK